MVNLQSFISAFYIFNYAHSYSTEIVDRRKAFASFVASSSAPWLIGVDPINAANEESIIAYDYENRDRNKNKEALIRDDYWYFTNRYL